MPLLTLITLAPLIGGLLVLTTCRGEAAKRTALAFGLFPLALAVLAWSRFDTASADMQFVERFPWLPSLGIEYHLGIDGLGLLMVLLSAIVVPFALLASWKIADRPHLFFALMLFLQTGLFGTFTALNFFHWFIFWEAGLVPAFFLVKIWGGEGRTAAAYQFFVYTLVGSVAMLLAFLGLFAATNTFDFIELASQARSGALATAVGNNIVWSGWTKDAVLLLLFTGVFLGFAVKVPLLPFHTWLPATYTEAPASVSMVLTGTMSKMGVYGFLRILLPIFPEQLRALQTPLLGLAVATIVLSAFAALAQRDLKRILAYSSINHLGCCLLGIFAVATAGSGSMWASERSAALNGVLLQMFNHGITASALFYFVGLIEARTGLRGLDDFGGLRKVAPVFCGLMGIALFASLGLPGLNGFVGEFLIFKGVFSLAPWAAAVSTVGLLVTAVFLLVILQRVWSGPLKEQANGFGDLTLSERVIAGPTIALMFIIGLYPQPVIGFINASAGKIAALATL